MTEFYKERRFDRGFRIPFVTAFLLLMTIFFVEGQDPERMDKQWGGNEALRRQADPDRGELFRDGNYAMFIHWGLYSQLANKYKGETYYGIGEWIMNPRMAGIPVDEYKEIAKEFNPVKFDAERIARLAKDAGMKYIIITSKHHDGFAMYDSEVSDFNIVDATPFNRDPMKELARACKKEGLGFGFYYSQNQDWTAPGGTRGPEKDKQGNTVSFDEYFHNKCLPQVKEITTEYGDMVLIWFDTPAGMPEKYAQTLLEVVHENQPKAFVSGRVGFGLGDYQTLGDMEVPHQNVEGLWEAVDVTNDSWGYAWYDQNWKSPKDILSRLISTVARGGTYMLNIGPKSDGSVPFYAAKSLETSGKWIDKYPDVIYKADPSPWKHAQVWGDVTVNEDKLFLTVFEWPDNEKLYLPGLKNEIESLQLLEGNKRSSLNYKKVDNYTMIEVPCRQPEEFVTVIEMKVKGKPEVDTCFAIDPELKTTVTTHFASAVNSIKDDKRWMEKFGEWKLVNNINDWKDNSEAIWEVDVLKAGEYMVDLNYTGEGRLVWSVETDEGEKIQNQQNSTHVFSSYPIGWIKFDKPGKHKITVRLEEGNPSARLAAISLKAIDFGK